MNELIVTLWRTFSRGRRSEYTWREFVDTFIRDPEIIQEKTQAAGFSLGSFTENRRAISRVERVYALTLDFDGGDTTLEQSERLIKNTGGVAYTTFSHSPEYPKLRVIYRFDRPVDADEYSRIWIHFAKKIAENGHTLDESARDASRFWYLPSHRPKAPYAWRELEGDPIAADRVLEEAPHTPPFIPGGSAAPRKWADRCVPIVGGVGAETFFGRVFELAGMSFDSLLNGSLPVLCPWSQEHTSGFDGDSSTVILPPTTDSRWGLFHCSHAHCARRKTTDLLDVLPVDALDVARREHGRGMLRAKVIRGWEERLEPLYELPGMDRFVLRCKPRGFTPVFTMTVKESSSTHLQYLGGLPLPELIGRRLDVSMEGREIKAARLVP